jgi:TolB-like protein
MGRDENGTLARLKAHRIERLDPALVRHGGRLVKLTGDGALVEFRSAVDALAAAIEFQQTMADANQKEPEETAVVFRIGLHLGDLIVDGDDLYGDGVNVAARLEAEAVPGGIVISGDVHNAVAGRLKAAFDDLGNLALKNIERPIQAFGVKWDSANWKLSAAQSAQVSVRAPGASMDVPLSLPDKPSIAVLPFQNMSGDPEQEYFVDGLVEDIITALSRFKSLFVIARNSSFTYKGKAVDVRQVGSELGVRYLMEGSVRKAGSRLRITCQLIVAGTGAHLWADRFDGALEDVFDLQDDVTEKVIAALAPSVEQAEIDRATRKPTANLDAHDCYLRAMAAWQAPSRENIKSSIGLLRHALKLDPGHSSALGLLLAHYADWRGFGMTGDADIDDAEVAGLIRRAVKIGRDDAVALGHTAWAIAHVPRDLAFAEEQVKRALTLNPNLAAAWAYSGWINLWSGRAAEALEDLSRSMRLDPLHPSAGKLNVLAHANFFLGRHEEAQQWAESQLRNNPDAHPGLRMGAASAAFAGMHDQARTLAARLQHVDPEFRVSRLEHYLGPYQSPEYLEKYKRGLRMAGLPE